MNIKDSLLMLNTLFSTFSPKIKNNSDNAYTTYNDKEIKSFVVHSHNYSGVRKKKKQK